MTGRQQVYISSVEPFLLGGLDKCRLKRLTLPILLQPVSENKGVVHFIVLKNVQSAIKGDFPAVVGDDMAGVKGAGSVEFPGKMDARGHAGGFYLFKILFLLFSFERVFHRRQVNDDLFVPCLEFDHRLDQLHQIADLVKQADIGVGNRDSGRPPQIGAEEGVVGNAFLVFLEGEMLFFQDGLDRKSVV